MNSFEMLTLQEVADILQMDYKGCVKWAKEAKRHRGFPLCQLSTRRYRVRREAFMYWLIANGAENSFLDRVRSLNSNKRNK